MGFWESMAATYPLPSHMFFSSLQVFYYSAVALEVSRGYLLQAYKCCLLETSSLFGVYGKGREDDGAGHNYFVDCFNTLRVPGLEGFLIPSKTRGHILKLIDGNTALVRWECTQSGVAVLLLRLAQKIYLDSNEEVLVIFDLLCRLVTFSSCNPELKLDTTKDFEKSANSEKSAEVSYEDDNDVNTD
ncbi:hypothetical protein POM88_031177 [Heracleum sosnowskyi]|uniref:Uncharacterized protein n=1 Tax=Heracleum sosnowskyi TaxID=360622 RepID=A0AAD8HY55_9APIA|nr:hypothetical protein POM88_031177 [Heracleum sosnowskyi]